MAEYIDRNEIPAPYYIEEYDEYVVGIGEINSIPTADVQEVKHGKWEHNIEEMGIFKHHYIACPCCNDWFNIVNVHLLIGDGKLFDFCPSCGAKMEKEREENA